MKERGQERWIDGKEKDGLGEMRGLAASPGSRVHYLLLALESVQHEYTHITYCFSNVITDADVLSVWRCC